MRKKNLKIIKVSLSLLFSFILLISCKQNTSYPYSLSWEENNLYYGMSQEVGTLGEVFFLNMKADLQPAVEYQMVTTGGNPIEQSVWQHYFTDLQKTQSRIELIWYEEGEFVIDDLAVQFNHLVKNQTTIIPLEPIVIEIKSQLELPEISANSHSNLNQNILPNLSKKIHPLNSFKINNPKLIYLLIIFFLVLVIIGIILLIFFLLKIKQKDQTELRLEEAKTLFSDYKTDPTDIEKMVFLYDIYYWGLSFLPHSRLKYNKQKYNIICEFLEPNLFAKEKKCLGSSIQRGKFINLYQNFLEDVESAIESRKLKNKKEEK